MTSRATSGVYWRRSEKENGISEVFPVGHAAVELVTCVPIGSMSQNDVVYESTVRSVAQGH